MTNERQNVSRIFENNNYYVPIEQNCSVMAVLLFSNEFRSLIRNDIRHKLERTRKYK